MIHFTHFETSPKIPKSLRNPKKGPAGVGDNSWSAIGVKVIV